MDHGEDSPGESPARGQEAGSAGMRRAAVHLDSAARLDQLDDAVNEAPDTSSRGSRGVR